MSDTPTARTVLIVDDEPRRIARLARVVGRQGFTSTAVRTGAIAMQSVIDARPDLVLIDADVADGDGLNVCRFLRADARTRFIPLILLIARHTRAHRLQGLDAGADDVLTKRCNSLELEARMRSLTRLKRYTDEVDSAESVILSLGSTIEARDPHTRGHCERLVGYATALGTRIGLDHDQLHALRRGAFVHDLGKVGIPDAILLKRGKLTPSEYKVMQDHTVIGDRLCGELRSLQAVRPIVRHHHERLDGTGYPDRLRGEQIPLLARVLSVVDVYDAMTTERPYKAAVSPERAIAELRAEVARGWKPRDLVEDFAALVSKPALIRVPIRQRAGRVSPAVVCPTPITCVA